MVGQELPAGWQELEEPGDNPAEPGLRYFVHVDSQTSLWALPATLRTAESWTLVGGNEQRVVTNDGFVYLYNMETKASRWDPDACAAATRAKRKRKAPDAAAGGSDTAGATAPPLAALPFTAADAAGPAQHEDHLLPPPLPARPLKAPAVPTGPPENPAAFRDLLIEYGIKPGATWDDERARVSRDPRYRAIHTERDRRRAFESFLRNYVLEERKIVEQRLRAQRRAFSALLQEHKAAITHSTKLEGFLALPQIAGDPRAHGIEAKEARAMLETIVGPLRADLDAARTAFRALLQEAAAKGTVNEDSRWSKARPLLETDARFAAFGASDNERKKVFYAFTEELFDATL